MCNKTNVYCNGLWRLWGWKYGDEISACKSVGKSYCFTLKSFQITIAYVFILKVVFSIWLYLNTLPFEFCSFFGKLFNESYLKNDKKIGKVWSNITYSFAPFRPINCSCLVPLILAYDLGMFISLVLLYLFRLIFLVLHHSGWLTPLCYILVPRCHLLYLITQPVCI